MLGRDLSAIIEKNNIDYISTDSEVDITSYREIKDKASVIKPSWIVNCAAYTDVDRAEDDEEKAFLINSVGAKNIGLVASEHDIPLIHISTDYVFNGKSSIPIEEDSAASPLGAYGRSKLSGENEIIRICRKFFIIRTAWLYGRFGKNFVDTMINLMNTRESIKVVSDQKGSPTWTCELSGLIIEIIKRRSSDYGIYHMSGEGQCSWYEFALDIYNKGRLSELISSECRIESCRSSEFPVKAKRPSYSLLSKNKIKKTFNYIPKHWKETLEDYLKTKKDV